MESSNDHTRTSLSDSGQAGVTRASPEKQRVMSSLKPEIDQWQVKIDAAKLQMHLGAKDVQENLRPQVERLEQGLFRAKASFAQLEESSESAWKDSYHGLKISLLAIRRSFDEVKQHFENLDDS